MLLAGCAGSLTAQLTSQNELLEDVRITDLSAQQPTQVKQTNRGPREPAVKQPALYPGDDRIEPQRRSSADAAARNTVRRGTDGYQLNFENASIADVAKAVLGDTLQMPYIIDPRVQGQVTLSTGRAVTRDELVKVFETALRLNNGALVGDARGYRIIPAGEAAAGDIDSVQPLRRGESLPPGYGVTVMPLRHVSAEAMLRLVEGFLARAGSVRAEATGNLLLIRGGSRERESIVDVVENFDVDWLKGQSAGVFPLTHANPEELIQELQQVMQTEPGTLNASMVRFQAIARLNAILVLARRVDHLREAGTWIRRLDKSNSAGQNLYVYQVENGKASDLAQLLNDTFGSGGGGTTRRTPRAEIAPGQTASQFSSPGLQGQQRGGLQPGLGQTSAQPQAAAPVQRAAPGPSSGGGSPGGSGTGATAAIDARIIADEASNALLIRASQSDYQRILAALRQVDKPPMQVLINATIAEVTLTHALRYGVQAYLRNHQGSVGYHPGPSDLTLSPTFPGLNLLIGMAADPKVVLDALAQVTNVKVVSSPSVVVVDNQPATLRVGDEVPVSTQQAQIISNSNTPILNSIQFRATGVILKVTPRVNSSGLVTMDVEQEISQVAPNADGTTTTSLTPTISQRRISSTVAVYSGQTVVLGGLISEQDNRDKKSVPLLNSVPVLGDLIGRTQFTNKRTELIVFIKPQVIRNSSDASEVSEELRSKLKSMAFEPVPQDPHRRGWATQTQTRSIKDP